jgi:Right handed beta helix region
MFTRRLLAVVAASLSVTLWQFDAPGSPLFAQTSAFTNVNCNAPGVRLQQHLDNAPTGATLGIVGSCADGPFSIRRDVALVGGAIHSLSAPNGSNYVLVITEGARVRMRDLGINAQGVQLGIQINGGSSLVARNLTVENALRLAMEVVANSTLTLLDSRLRLNSSGLTLSDSSQASIASSSISDNSFLGVTLEAGSTVTMHDTQIGNNGHTGLLIKGLSVASLTDNTTISGNQFMGVRVEFANTGLRIFNQPSMPSTIESNSPIDVSCVPGSFIEVSHPVISSTKLADIDPACMVRSLPIFAP